MPPHPVGDGNAVTVAQGMYHSSDTRQVVAAAREAVPPPMPPGGRLYHCCTVSAIRVRPLLAQLAQLNDPAAAVVVGHPTWYLIGCDGGDEHGGAVVGERE